MLEVGQPAELALEREDQLGVGAPQRLERHLRAALAVEHLVDDPHAPGAQAVQHLEALRTAELRHAPRNTILPAESL